MPKQFDKSVGSSRELELSEVIDKSSRGTLIDAGRSAVFILRQRRYQYVVVRPAGNCVNFFAPPNEDSEGRELRDHRDVIEVAVFSPPHLVSLEVAPRDGVQVLDVFHVLTPPYKVLEPVVMSLDG